MYTIDKSAFTAEELEQFEALVAKATVDPKAAEEEMEDDIPEDAPPAKPAKKKCGNKPAKKSEEEEEVVETNKSAPETSPELKKVMDELEAMKKSFEMKEMLDVAKKYAPLGKKEDELAHTLIDMKKSSDATYKAFISVLDEQLALQDKMGIFNEIGKSSGGYSAASGSEAKAEAKAQEIMKSNPDMDYVTAIAKAYEDPAIMEECDTEYFGRR